MISVHPSGSCKRLKFVPLTQTVRGMKLIFKLAQEDDSTTQFESTHCHNRETVGVLAKRKGTRRIIKNLARCCVQHGHTGTLLMKESMQHKKVAILL